LKEFWKIKRKVEKQTKVVDDIERNIISLSQKTDA
jgi:hypothetical protein